MSNDFTGQISEKLKSADHTEGKVAKTIEEQTAKLPSDVFLWAAIASIGASLTLKLMGHKHTALFVGQWPAPFLLLGLYNKIVKVAGHDQKDDESNHS
ncbi:MAG: hypothetical protein H7Y03_00660 [Chitinophagaceae bacterium]|nr:hypothetical protein [Chitinophagaceae bacterium]